jgi:hypothetical protein
VRVGTVALALGVVVLTAGCVGSGKTARDSNLEPLPAGLTVVSDSTSGCRAGESGFDYRYFVVGGTTDLSDAGPLEQSLIDRGYYHTINLTDDLPWADAGYWLQSASLRAEIGLLSDYLQHTQPYSGPDPASLPAEVRAHPEQYLLVAMRPTDFACATPL